MKPCLVLLLVGIALSSTLAANVHGEQGHAEEHRVVRRGILEKISSAARSLRDEASSFFERSWAGLKGALTEFLNWMRGISPPKDDHANRPPPVLPPADLPEGPHQYYPGWEPTNVGDSKDPPTVHPSRYSPSATSSANAGDSHSTPETTRQETTTSTDASGVISHRAGSPNTEDTSSATQTPSLATSTSPEATKTVGPSEASTEPRVESTTERVVSTSGEVVVTAGATSTSTETVSKSTAAEDRGPTAKVDSSTPAILATRDPKLPDEVDESENDIDLPPPRPPAQPKRTNGGGYVISDAR
ncbi:A-agglutinin anchorage subunit [Ixodes scapularis]|uniref:A-agglutinin anchorage subunit n=1 Tax=Ixodes scapularis TaxID=6945 RepID=UPI001C382C8D|nr:A-agglutinin anchorage subunit [Ixodes scapularis]